MIDILVGRAIDMMGAISSELKTIDAETRGLLVRLIVRAVKSGAANEYLRERLQWLMDSEDSQKEGAVTHPPHWKTVSK